MGPVLEARELRPASQFKPTYECRSTVVVVDSLRTEELWDLELSPFTCKAVVFPDSPSALEFLSGLPTQENHNLSLAQIKGLIVHTEDLLQTSSMFGKEDADRLMPAMIDFMQKLESSTGSKDLRVLFISEWAGFIKRSEQLEMRQAGAAGIVELPDIFESERFGRVLRRIISRPEGSQKGAFVAMIPSLKGKYPRGRWGEPAA